MRRQFVSNVAFYSTTAVLILIIVLCIGATVKSESRDETQRMENRIQEQQLMSDMKQYLNENGYRNSGVTLTYALEEDGSPDYTFTIHHKKVPVPPSGTIQRVLPHPPAGEYSYYP